MRRTIQFTLAVSLLFLASCGSGNPVVIIETSMGNIKVELNESEAPISVKNFLKYVDDKHYDGTIFHRVISDFMIQGGGFTPNMKEKVTRAPIKNEGRNGLSNVRGTIAMARTEEFDSATDQFYINVADNSEGLGPKEPRPPFDPGSPGYAVFGKVIEGMDVVDKITQVKTHTIEVKREVEHLGEKKVIDMPYRDVPVEPVIIKTIRRVEN